MPIILIQDWASTDDRERLPTRNKVVQKSDGTLVALHYDYALNQLWTEDSTDEGDTWINQTLIYDGDAGGYVVKGRAAMVIDSSDVLHVFFFGDGSVSGEYTLFYMNSTAWGSLTELFEFTGMGGNSQFLACCAEIASNGDIHVGFNDPDNNIYYLMTYSSSVWGAAENVSQFGGGEDWATAAGFGLCVDSSSTVHYHWCMTGIGTYTGYAQLVHRSRTSAGAWSGRTLVTDLDQIDNYYVDATTDIGGVEIHLAVYGWDYSGGGEEVISYFNRNGSSVWSRTVLTQISWNDDEYNAPGICQTLNGTLHVIYGHANSVTNWAFNIEMFENDGSWGSMQELIAASSTQSHYGFAPIDSYHPSTNRLGAGAAFYVFRSNLANGHEEIYFFKTTDAVFLGGLFPVGTDLTLLNSLFYELDTELTLSTSLTGLFEMIKNFNRSALILQNDIQGILPFEVTLPVVTELMLNDPVEIDLTGFMNIYDTGPTPVDAKIDYRVLLDGQDVSGKIRTLVVSYTLGQFAGTVDVQWADWTIFKTIDPAGLNDPRYRQERLVVHTRKNPSGDWILQGRFLVERRQIQAVYNSTYPKTWGRNRPALMDDPYGKPISRVWSSDTFARLIAQEVVDEVNAYSPVPVNLVWNVPDYPVLGSNFEVSQQKPIQIISTLAKVVGGILTTNKDGDLIVTFRYGD